MEPPAWLRRPSTQGLLLGLLTAAAYAGVLRVGFVWDDYALVLYNDATADLSDLGRIFGEDLWGSADGGHASGYYRPLMLLTLALDRALFGFAPQPYHLHNLLWHLLAVWGLHRLLLRLTAPRPALLGAAFFALHPVQCEAVVWIAARNDLLAAALLLGSVSLLLPREPGRLRLALGALMAFGAVLSKESALLAPLVLLVLDGVVHRRPVGWPRHLALWCAVAAYGLLRVLAGVNAAAAPPALGWQVLRQRAWDVAATCGGLLVWPWPLSGGRDLESLDLAWPALALGTAVCLLLPLALLWPRAKRSLAAAGLVWTLVTFTPAVLALADKALFGERYLYLPLAGLALALAAALCGLGPSRRASLLLGAAVLLPWMLLIQRRVPDWHDDVSLWRAALRDTPSGYVHAGLGHVLYRDGQYLEALDHFREALALQPPRLEVCGHVPAVASKAGDFRLAVSATEEAAARGCRDPAFVGHRAVLLAMAGRWDEALTLAEGVDDPRRRAALVRVAWGIVEGDCAGYRELLSSWKGDEQMAPQLARILRLGGYEAQARDLQAGIICAGSGKEGPEEMGPEEMGAEAGAP